MRREGFTLIEILIAVAIVATLIGFMVPNFLGIRVRARDARRKSDLSQIQKSLELYKLDQSSPSYPADGFMDTLCNQCWASGVGCTGNIYMRRVPCDPVGIGPYLYTRDFSDDLRYSLTACLENQDDPDEDPIGHATCAGMGRESYTINEP